MKLTNKRKYPRLMVSTRWEAEKWCHEYDSVLTVFTPASLCEYGHPDQTVVEFSDRYHYSDGAPTMTQFQRILDWADEHKNDRSVLVHCKAGQSRSTAVAIALFVAWGMEPAKAVEHVYRKCRPKDKIGERPFIPNLRILEHIDTVFGSELADADIIRDAFRDPEWKLAPGEDWVPTSEMAK